MVEQDEMQSTMQLLVKAGDAKKQAQQAIKLAREGKLAEAHQQMAEAEETANEAHNTQTKMLTKEAQGKPLRLTLLTVHAQDHLMTAITYIDLAKEIICLYEKLAEK